MNTRQRGLTLIELMVTLAVAIILIAVGMPLFSGVAANNQATAQANNLMSAIRLARNEAVKRAEVVRVCPVVDASATPPVCGNAGSWPNGWTVHFDDGDVMNEHIRVWEAPSGTPAINSNGAAFVRFDATGAMPPGDAAVNISLGTTGTVTSQLRCVSVTVAGQVRVNKYNPGAGETCP